MAWETFNRLAIMDWMFLYAYPMAFISLVVMLFLLVEDITLLRKKRQKIYFLLIGFDILVPICSYILFEAYYSLIGHM
jgi:hypothetical protein